MNKKILETLSFHQVKHQIQAFTSSAQGAWELSRLLPSTDAQVVQNWLDETQEGLLIERLQGGIPIPKLESITPHMQRIAVGADLNGLELAQVRRVLATVKDIKQFATRLNEEALTCPRFAAWVAQLVFLPEFYQQLTLALTEDGGVTDEASVELKNIRQKIKRSEQAIHEQLDAILRSNQARYLSDLLVTMRNDRYVLPVKQEYRGQFGGVVHDQSASGQTLFIEPKQTVDLNNRLRQYQSAEKAEITRILAALSAELVPYQQELLHNATVIGKLDVMNAKARFGKAWRANVPEISAENHVQLKQARHPLLDQNTVVANDIAIGNAVQTVVITGPNTGGKTLTLKTLGLLQLMGQAGLPLPVAPESQIGIFSNIFADIGDEQSIEQSLSTFSSHMKNIVGTLEAIDANSLVLLDELGAGTDPQEGAALAIAILDAIGATGAYVMATTHYPELKVYGYQRPGTINASMEFDVQTLRPTYRLLIGVPGRSNAFEISKRLGLNPFIIEQARQLMDEESQTLNEMIADLENQRHKMETQVEETQAYLKESTQLYHDLKEAYHYFSEERNKELEKARQKANHLVEKAQSEAENIIRELKQQQQQNQATIKEHELIEAKTRLANLHQQETQLKQNKVLQKAKEQKAFKIGDDVLVQTYGQRGTLIGKLKDDTWQVQMGILKMNVAEADMTKIAPEKEPKHTHTHVKTQQSHVPTQLDLRGKRYEEALAEVDQYLDAAILAGYAQVTIVHGKGTGALRTGITDYLKQNRSVKSFAFAPANQGGNGATIVKFV